MVLRKSVLSQMPYIDCQKIADKILDDTKRMTRYHTPWVVVFVSSEDDTGSAYLKRLQALGSEANVAITSYNMPATAEDLNIAIQNLNRLETVNGIMLISEPPSLFESRNIISPLKNVEGNDFDDDVEKVFCTARSCLRILQEVTDIENKNAVIVGYGKRAGKPLSYLLMRAHVGSVTTTHKYTMDLESHLERADIIVSAVGRQFLISKPMVKRGAFVIDAGISYAKGKVVGDVCPEVSDIAQVTPVPGGVGPVTCALLLKNAAMLCQKQAELCA